MTETMKYCPFCGEEDTEIAPGICGDWYIGCLSCNYKIHVADCTEEEAIRYWNTRPVEDALMNVITTLCSYIDAIDEEAGKTLPDVIDSKFMNGANAHETSLVKIELMIFRCKEKCACEIKPFLKKGTQEKGGEDE